MARSPTKGAIRPLLAVVVLVMLPGLLLAYFGLRGVGEREGNLRTQYVVTSTLVRDRLVAELTRLELDLAAKVDSVGGFDESQLESPSATSRRLEALTAAHPWLEQPFLIRASGGVTTGTVGANWLRRADDPLRTFPRAASLLAEAETAEFVRADLESALRLYREVLKAVPPGSRAAAFALTRVGRTLFNLKRADEAVGVYRQALAMSSDAVDRNGLPFAVIALIQIIDGAAILGRADEKARAEGDLLEYLVNRPWDLEYGYGWYLNRALEAATPDNVFRERGQKLAASAANLAWIRKEVEPRIRAELRPRLADIDGPGHLAVERNGQFVLIGYQRFLGHSASDDSLVLGYEVRPEYLRGPMLAGILRIIDLGREVTAVLADRDLTAADGTNLDRQEALAQSPLLESSPGWRVALVDAQGRSIGQLVARERWTYGTLIVGMLTVMVVGLVAVVRASARATELSRTKSEFVANVSHELKTPLALIRMFGETLESGIVSDDRKRQEFYGVIRRESERLTHLINNVLDIGRIDADNKRYELTRGNLVETVREAVDAYRPLFGRLGFQVEMVLPDAPIELFMDREAIVQALVNLFQNVIKYSSDHPYVDVSITADGAWAQVSVTDHGVGIPADEIPRIFEPYYRVPGSTSAGPSGSGLGLSIVKHAVAAHGGRVEVASTPGQGSVFTLVLPMMGTLVPAVGHEVVVARVEA